MNPTVGGTINGNLQTFNYAYENGLRKRIQKKDNKITIETFKNEEALKAENPFKVKTLSYSPATQKWMATSRYSQPNQYICYDIKDGAVVGAHLDTMRPDIKRALNFDDKAVVSDIRATLNYLIKHTK